MIRTKHKSMKPEKILSHELNNEVLSIMERIQEAYPGSKTIVMNLKTISKELNELTIKQINKDE